MRDRSRSPTSPSPAEERQVTLERLRERRVSLSPDEVDELRELGLPEIEAFPFPFPIW